MHTGNNVIIFANLATYPSTCRRKEAVRLNAPRPSERGARRTASGETAVYLLGEVYLAAPRDKVKHSEGARRCLFNIAYLLFPNASVPTPAAKRVSCFAMTNAQNSPKTIRELVDEVERIRKTCYTFNGI
jgi:hypothetical protein